MRSILASILTVCVLVLSSAPILVFATGAGSPSLQGPDVRPFDSAHFGMVGVVKFDGVTIDVLGEGDLDPPSRQHSAFKFGPFTAEIIMLDDAVYTRTRFERRWEREFSPRPVDLGPLSATDLLDIQQDVRLVGSESVDGVQTQHYTTDLRFGSALEPLLPLVEDADARTALQTLRGTVDVWVGTQDRMVRQERLVLTVMLPAIEPEGDQTAATIDLTIAYSRLNEPVMVEQPIRNDPSPLRSPQPNVVPVAGPAGSPSAGTTRQPRPGPAPVQLPKQ